MAEHVNEFLKTLKTRRNFIRFVFANGTAALLNFGLYYGGYMCFNMNYILASVVSYAVALVFSYYLNKCFVFSSQKKTKKTTFYYSIFKILMGISGDLLLVIQVEILGIWKSASWLITTAISFIATYLISSIIFVGRQE